MRQRLVKRDMIGKGKYRRTAEVLKQFSTAPF
jgi:hypothetical protein